MEGETQPGERTADDDLRLLGLDARSFNARRLRAQFRVPDLAQLRVVFSLAVAFDDCDGSGRFVFE
jgi:hypothetical protein